VCALIFALLVGGCSGEKKPSVEPVRPVKTFLVTAGGQTQMRAFPGRVEASRRAELAFQVPGVLVQLPVKEGQRVAAGEVIAQLRKDEFQARLTSLQGQLNQARAGLRALQGGERPEEIRRLEANVRAAEARLVNARTEFDRHSRLVRTNVVSRQEFDRAQTAYRVAQEDLKAARQSLEQGTIGREEDIEAMEASVQGLEGRVVEANIQLEDTTMRAPFDGVIAQRFVELNQNVAAKAPIVRFQDVEEIEVVVDVPETVMATIRSAGIVQIAAEFSGAPGVQFPVEVREYSQVADPTTQTFQVRVVMKSPPEVNLLPGMTSTVTLTYRRAEILGSRLLVPITALSQEPNQEQVVWVIGDDQAVSRRPVKTGRALAGEIEITAGLQPGERIVVAGVRQLRDGMQVRDLGDALGGSQS
jgi:RND family efflux transporter MFP subunit